MRTHIGAGNNIILSTLFIILTKGRFNISSCSGWQALHNRRACPREELLESLERWKITVFENRTFLGEFLFRSASWSRSRSTRTSARWLGRTRATSTRWPKCYLLFLTPHVVIEGVMIYLCIVWELIIEVIGDISAQTKGCGRRSRLHEWTLTCSFFNRPSLKGSWQGNNIIFIGQISIKFYKM